MLFGTRDIEMATLLLGPNRNINLNFSSRCNLCALSAFNVILCLLPKCHLMKTRQFNFIFKTQIRGYKILTQINNEMVFGPISNDAQISNELVLVNWQ